MQIYIGADHRGFELKQKLITWLQKNTYIVTDCGNDHLDPDDDYPEFSARVAEAVSANPDSLGIVICGSGVGMCLVADKVDGARCVLGFDPDQIKHARESDNCNVLSLPAEYIDDKKAQELVTAFLTTAYQPNDRRQRRQQQIHNLEFQS